MYEVLLLVCHFLALLVQSNDQLVVSLHGRERITTIRITLLLRFRALFARFIFAILHLIEELLLPSGLLFAVPVRILLTSIFIFSVLFALLASLQ